MKLLKVHHDHLAMLADSDIWNTTFAPIMRARMQDAMEQMLKPITDRRDHLSDDELRGRANAIRQLLMLPEADAKREVMKQEEERRKREFDERETRAARVLATQGRSGPDAVRPPISDDPVTPVTPGGGIE